MAARRPFTPRGPRPHAGAFPLYPGLVGILGHPRGRIMAGYPHSLRRLCPLTQGRQGTFLRAVLPRAEFRPYITGCVEME